MSESFNLKCHIVAVDIEKAFDCSSNLFLLDCLKYCGYGYDFKK